MSKDKSNEVNKAMMAVARVMLRHELHEAVDRLKPEHQDSLVVQIAAKPLLQWLDDLDAAVAREARHAAAAKHAEEKQLMLAEFLLVVSKPALYSQSDLEDLQKRASKLLKESQS